MHPPRRPWMRACIPRDKRKPGQARASVFVHGHRSAGHGLVDYFSTSFNRRGPAFTISAGQPSWNSLKFSRKRAARAS